MKVFISWSGPRSRKVAEYLSGWLRKLPLTVRPWVSKEAIDPGTRWEKELSEALEGTTFGILCLTPENQLEPWICFESGALSKTVEKTYVIPYLIDMTPAELKHPLKQFQAIEANKKGTLHLIKTLHKASEDDAHTMDDIKETFEALWPKFEEIIISAKNEVSEPPDVKELSPPEIKNDLDKIVSLLESLSSRMTKLESRDSQKYTSLQWLQDEQGITLADFVKVEDETDKRYKAIYQGIKEAFSEKSYAKSKAQGILDLIKEREKIKNGKKDDRTKEEES